MRTTTIVPTADSPEIIRDKLGAILVNRGFAFTTFKNMQVWKKGSGFITAPQIFKIDMEGDAVKIESWMPTSILPGIYIGESGLDSGFGVAVKVGMRKTLLELVGAVLAQGREPAGYMPK